MRKAKMHINYFLIILIIVSCKQHSSTIKAIDSRAVPGSKEDFQNGFYNSGFYKEFEKNRKHLIGKRKKLVGKLGDFKKNQRISEIKDDRTIQEINQFLSLEKVYEESYYNNCPESWLRVNKVDSLLEVGTKESLEKLVPMLDYPFCRTEEALLVDNFSQVAKFDKGKEYRILQFIDQNFEVNLKRKIFFRLLKTGESNYPYWLVDKSYPIGDPVKISLMQEIIDTMSVFDHTVAKKVSVVLERYYALHVNEYKSKSSHDAAYVHSVFWMKLFNSYANDADLKKDFWRYSLALAVERFHSSHGVRNKLLENGDKRIIPFLLKLKEIGDSRKNLKSLNYLLWRIGHPISSEEFKDMVSDSRIINDILKTDIKKEELLLNDRIFEVIFRVKNHRPGSRVNILTEYKLNQDLAVNYFRDLNSEELIKNLPKGWIKENTYYPPAKFNYDPYTKEELFDDIKSLHVLANTDEVTKDASEDIFYYRALKSINVIRKRFFDLLGESSFYSGGTISNKLEELKEIGHPYFKTFDFFIIDDTFLADSKQDVNRVYEDKIVLELNGRYYFISWSKFLDCNDYSAPNKCFITMMNDVFEKVDAPLRMRNSGYYAIKGVFLDNVEK